MALERLDDDEKGVSLIYTPGGTQQMAIVNEPGLYSLILGSRKPKAKAFKRWVTHADQATGKTVYQTSLILLRILQYTGILTVYQPHVQYTPK